MWNLQHLVKDADYRGGVAKLTRYTDLKQVTCKWRVLFIDVTCTVSVSYVRSRWLIVFSGWYACIHIIVNGVLVAYMSYLLGDNFISWSKLNLLF